MPDAPGEPEAEPEKKRRFKPRRPTVRPKVQEEAEAAPDEAANGRGRGRGKGGGRLRRNDKSSKNKAPQGQAFFETSAVPSSSSVGGGRGSKSAGSSGVKPKLEADVTMMEEDSADGGGSDEDENDDRADAMDPEAPVRLGGAEEADGPTTMNAKAPMTEQEEDALELSRMLEKPLLSDLAEDEWVTVQLPTQLPACLARVLDPSLKTEDEDDDEKKPVLAPKFENEDEELRPQYDDFAKLAHTGEPIGCIEILASGRTRLRIGEEVFDVERGLHTTMLQQVASIDTAKGLLYELGNVAEKVLVTRTCNDVYDPKWADIRKAKEEELDEEEIIMEPEVL